MKLSKLLPLFPCLLVGCSAAPNQLQKPTPVVATKSPCDSKAIEMEREREKQIRCSVEWMKTATALQKIKCTEQSSINQAMDALSAGAKSASH